MSEFSKKLLVLDSYTSDFVFSSVVPQVYEQLYDTLEIIGGPEVRAQATAKVLHPKEQLVFFFYV